MVNCLCWNGGLKMNQAQRDQLEKIKEEIEQIQSEEQDKYDNAPENLIDSERYETIQEIIDELQEIIDSLDNIIYR